MSRKVWNKKKRGFTLIELIIVIAIIAILMAILIPNMMGYTAQAQKTVCDDNIAQIERAFKAKYALDPNVRVNDIIKNTNGEYFTTTPACPSGGTYRGAAIEGTIYVVCTYHQNSGDPLSAAVTSYLNLDYFRGMTNQEIKDLTGDPNAYYNNDYLRSYLLKNTYGGKWPEFPDKDLLERNGLAGAYYIQPYVDAHGSAPSQDITVYINKNDGTSDKGKWYASAIFNPEDGEWYTGSEFQIMNQSWQGIKGQMQANNWHVMS